MALIYVTVVKTHNNSIEWIQMNQIESETNKFLAAVVVVVGGGGRGWRGGAP